jgi:hypothetical protein
MNDLINNFSPFWQGVLASLFAGILLLVIGKVFGLFRSEIKQSNIQRQKKIEDIRNKVLAADSVYRVEGYFHVLFTIFQWLFVANISWVISGIFVSIGLLYFISIFSSFICFYMGLREIFTLYKILKKDTIFIKNSVDHTGLQIQFAEYGYGDKYEDVKNIISKQLKDGRLYITANNEIFGDPNIGIAKNLNIVYSFDGNIHKRQIPEGEILSLP